MAPLGMDWDRLKSLTVIDLAHPWHRGMPVSPNHPPFQMALMRRHGDMRRPDGGSAANEIIVTGGHVGTHIDALCHVSHEGQLHGGVDAASVQSNHGFSAHGIETVEPIICRGILLDVAAAHGVECLDPGYEISAADLAEAEARSGAKVAPGDAILIRSGWSALWDRPEAFLGQVDGAPGPGVGAAEWIREREVRLAGAETIAFEFIPPAHGHAVLPVHRMLLVESGIHIMEAMDLEMLGSSGVAEFLFIVSPLLIVGATGSPVRPLAVVDA